MRPVIFILCVFSLFRAQDSWQSQIVYYNGKNELVYVADREGNRIPDFSYAGYKNSREEIPYIPVVKTISPVEGDNTSHIQSALEVVAAMEPDENGFRGALLLEAGLYEIRGTVTMNYDGVVLRGSGDGSDPAGNTILHATGDSPHQRSVIIAGGGISSRWKEGVPGSKYDIETDSVMAGERSFEVFKTSPYSVGDNIIIYHACTDAWLQAIDYGGTHSGEGDATEEDIPWTVGSQIIIYNRYITAIDGNTITIDAPVYNHLIKSEATSYVYINLRYKLRTLLGIENLRVDIETAGGTDENHAWQAMDLYLIEDAWVRDCTILHFGQSGIRTNTASRITVENCNALDPVSLIDGERRYNFNAYTASQLILFRNCHATNGRHHYVSNGTSYTSGVVFLDCTSSGAYTSSEGHRQWSQGMLWDNHVELDGPRAGLNARLLGLYNRGYYGTSHGWAVAHSVAWNCDVAQGDLIVQKAPTAQNYAIGCFGKNVTGIRPPAPFDEPEGYIEGTNRSGLMPRSLFYAQLEARMNDTLNTIDQSMVMVPPSTFEVYPNRPNPFNPSTEIRYHLPAKGFTRIDVFEMSGRHVRSVFSGEQKSGHHAVRWDGDNNAGAPVSSGIYIYQVQVYMRAYSGKMILLR